LFIASWFHAFFFVQEQRSMPKAQHQAVEAAQQHAGATTDVDRVQ
jgi:hypothetical protein